MRDLGPKGWMRFPFEEGLAAWAAHADKASKAVEVDPANSQWLRCDGTWFVGVDALLNDAAGRLPDGPPLTGTAIETAQRLSDGAPLHAAQSSVCYEGYPRQGAEESDSAFSYRQTRDAAHVDGFHRIMPGRRRKLLERHAYILGIPLNEAPAGAAPFVIWEGGHEIIREAMERRLGDLDPATWADEDVTEAYQAARRQVFADCPRVEISVKPGEAYLTHRLALHGVAPWREGRGRRAIAYFRPEFDLDAAADDWLRRP